MTDPDNTVDQLTVPPVTLADTEGANVRYTSRSACDPAGNCATGTTAISLDRMPPAVTAPQLTTNPIPVTSSPTVTVAATDATSSVAGAEIWADNDPGAGHAAPMSLAGDIATGVISDLPPGIHTIGVRAWDMAGNWSPATTTELVVYDPAAGFVTGGGWIVPGGPDGHTDGTDTLPGLDGKSKANFGFVLKYHSWKATAPSGEFNFHYNIGVFHVKGVGYDWLVISSTQWRTSRASPGSTVGLPNTPSGSTHATPVSPASPTT